MTNASSYAIRGVALVRLGELSETFFPFQVSSPNPLFKTKIKGISPP